jgi:hypothetical protein
MKNILAAMLVIMMIIIPAFGASNLMNPNLNNWATTVTHAVNITGDVSVTGSISASGGSVANNNIANYIVTHGISNVGALYTTGAFSDTADATVGHLRVNSTSALYKGLNVGNNLGSTLKADHLSLNDTTIKHAIAGGISVGGASSFGGTTTINGSTTLAVTTADYLTVGGNIIPNTMVLTFPFGFNSTNTTLFIADEAWQVTKIEEAHTTAQTQTGEPATIDVMKCTSGQSPVQGTSMITAPMNLKSTANTVVTPTLSATVALADGNMISILFSGYRTGFAGGGLTIHMKRV